MVAFRAARPRRRRGSTFAQVMCVIAYWCLPSSILLTLSVSKLLADGRGPPKRDPHFWSSLRSELSSSSTGSGPEMQQEQLGGNTGTATPEYDTELARLVPNATHDTRPRQRHQVPVLPVVSTSTHNDPSMAMMPPSASNGRPDEAPVETAGLLLEEPTPTWCSGATAPASASASSVWSFASFTFYRSSDASLRREPDEYDRGPASPPCWSSSPSGDRAARAVANPSSSSTTPTGIINRSAATFLRPVRPVVTAGGDGRPARHSGAGSCQAIDVTAATTSGSRSGDAESCIKPSSASSSSSAPPSSGLVTSSTTTPPETKSAAGLAESSLASRPSTTTSAACPLPDHATSRRRKLFGSAAGALAAGGAMLLYLAANNAIVFPHDQRDSSRAVNIGLDGGGHGGAVEEQQPPLAVSTRTHIIPNASDYGDEEALELEVNSTPSTTTTLMNYSNSHISTTGRRDDHGREDQHDRDSVPRPRAKSEENNEEDEITRGISALMSRLEIADPKVGTRRPLKFAEAEAIQKKLLSEDNIGSAHLHVDRAAQASPTASPRGGDEDETADGATASGGKDEKLIQDLGQTAGKSVEGWQHLPQYLSAEAIETQQHDDIPPPAWSHFLPPGEQKDRYLVFTTPEDTKSITEHAGTTSRTRKEALSSSSQEERLHPAGEAGAQRQRLRQEHGEEKSAAFREEVTAGNTEDLPGSGAVAPWLPKWCHKRTMFDIGGTGKKFQAWTNLEHLPQHPTGSHGSSGERSEHIINSPPRPPPRPIIIVIGEYWHESDIHPTLDGYVHDSCNGWLNFLNDQHEHDNEDSLGLIVPLFRNLASADYLYWEGKSTFSSQRGYKSTNKAFRDADAGRAEEVQDDQDDGTRAPMDLNLSSFEVLDEMINRLRASGMTNHIQVAGHSGGCQFVQRWLLYSKVHTHENPIHVHISSCGTYGYLDHMRPSVQWKNSQCLPGSPDSHHTCESPQKDEWVDISSRRGAGGPDGLDDEDHHKTEGDLRRSGAEDGVESALPDVFHRRDYPRGSDEDYFRPELVADAWKRSNRAGGEKIDVRGYLNCHVLDRFKLHLIVNQLDHCTELTGRESSRTGLAISQAARKYDAIRKFEEDYLYPAVGCRHFRGKNKWALDRMNLPQLVAATKRDLAQGYTRYQREMVFYFWLRKYLTKEAEEGFIRHELLRWEHHSAWGLMKNVKMVLWNLRKHPSWYKLQRGNFCGDVHAEQVQAEELEEGHAGEATKEQGSPLAKGRARGQNKPESQRMAFLAKQDAQGARPAASGPAFPPNPGESISRGASLLIGKLFK